MWSSRKPRTFAVGLEPLMGVPVTLTSISGNLAHPCAATKVKPWALAPATRPSLPATPAATPWPVESALSVKPPAPWSTVQSAGAPGVGVEADLVQEAHGRHRGVGPVEEVAAERGGLHPERRGGGERRPVRVVRAAALHDVLAPGDGAERVAAVREAVAGGGGAWRPPERVRARRCRERRRSGPPFQRESSSGLSPHMARSAPHRRWSVHRVPVRTRFQTRTAAGC